VVVRCPWGRPAVTEQAPFDDNGEPFPTTYYVTCPALVAAISRIESAHAEQRRLRPELPSGVGGATRTGSLKCLHAHAAFALARPGYELGRRIVSEVEPLWPTDRCCMDGAH
jgi:uncharacterized protein